jgi:hypothetical protein
MHPNRKAFLTLALPPARLDAEPGVMAGPPVAPTPSGVPI